MITLSWFVFTLHKSLHTHHTPKNMQTQGWQLEQMTWSFPYANRLTIPCWCSVTSWFRWFHFPLFYVYHPRGSETSNSTPTVEFAAAIVQWHHLNLRSEKMRYSFVYKEKVNYFWRNQFVYLFLNGAIFLWKHFYILSGIELRLANGWCSVFQWCFQIYLLVDYFVGKCAKVNVVQIQNIAVTLIPILFWFDERQKKCLHVGLSQNKKITRDVVMSILLSFRSKNLRSWVHTVWLCKLI